MAAGAASALIVGATGNIGAELAKQLAAGGFKVLTAARANADVQLDICSLDSVRGLDKQIPDGVDHVVVCCGASQFGPLKSFTAEKWGAGIASKLISVTQLVVALVNQEEGCAGVLRDNGSITVTAGQLSRTINVFTPGIAANNAGLEAFVKNAGLEMPRGLRMNAVSPCLVLETAMKAKLPTEGAVPAADVAATYLPLITGSDTATVVDAGVQVAFKKSHQSETTDKTSAES